MVSGCIGVNAGEVYAMLVVGGGECPGDAGGVWNRSSSSSSSPIRSSKGRGGGASVICSSRLRGGLGGRAMNSSVKGDEMVVGGVVVIVDEWMRMGLRGVNLVVFKGASRLITVGCF